MVALVPLLSRLELLDKVHGIDSSVLREICGNSDTEETNVMGHHNMLLRDLLKLIPWAQFNRLVDKHLADYRVRGFATKHQFIALLFAQLNKAQSLREIEGILASHDARLYHLGASAPKRSTLSRANRSRSSDVFTELFGLLLARMRQKSKACKEMDEAVLVMDATTIPLNALSQAWARSKKKHGAAAKIHVTYDLSEALPVAFEITPERTNDITQAKATMLVSGATYVIDLGYYNFDWMRAMHDGKCRFVTRLKKNTAPRIIEERAVATDGPIRSERVIRIDGRLTGNRKNPLADIDLREIEIVLDTGKRLRILTNDLDAPAEEITALYKARWQIELFFKWIKQNLKISHFLGTSENAVRIQVAVAMIAYLLIRMAHGLQHSVNNLLMFTRLVRAHLMSPRSIAELATEPPRNPRNANQMSLQLC